MGRTDTTGDQEMRDIFRREEPSAGFAQRVIAAAAREKHERWMYVWRRAIAAVLLLCVGLAVTSIAREQQRRQREEQAAEQLRLGLNITSKEVDKAERVIAGIQIQALR